METSTAPRGHRKTWWIFAVAFAVGAVTTGVSLLVRALTISMLSQNIAGGLSARPEVENWADPAAGIDPVGNTVGLLVAILGLLVFAVAIVVVRRRRTLQVVGLNPQE